MSSWHAGLIKKLRAARMQGRALRLLMDYLRRRFIRVVTGSVSSKLKRVHSSVPQGGKWSAPLWDFEISTLGDLDLVGDLMCYADDCSLVYVIDESNRSTVVANVNRDLALLEDWGVEWHVSFEPTKTHSIVISRKDTPFVASGVRFMDEEIGAVEEMKLVGFIFDCKMTMAPMVDHVARKARAKLAAICRLRQHLDDKNLEQMYKAFVRSTIEYGNLVYMSAATSNKQKVDRVQARAEKVGGFTVESLDSRRSAALIGFVFKLLDGDGRGLLNEFIPTVVEPVSSSSRSSRQVKRSEIKHMFDFRDTSKQYDRSIGGQIPVVWEKIPDDLLHDQKGDGWKKNTKNCQRFLTGKKLTDNHNKKTKTNKRCKIMNISSSELMSDGNKVLNNELNVKLDFNALAAELKSQGINFNKSLITL